MHTIKELQAALDDHGYVVAPGALETATVQALRDVCARQVEQHAAALREANLLEDAAEEEPLERRLVTLYARHPELRPERLDRALYDPAFHALLLHGWASDVAHGILGAALRLDPWFRVELAWPHTPPGYAWRQDAAVIAEGRRAAGAAAHADLRALCVWTPLVSAAPGKGGLLAIPGTHRRGLAPHAAATEGCPVEPHALTDAAAPEAIAVAPGDVVLYNPYLIVAREPNESDDLLWNIAWRYHDAAACSAREATAPLALRAAAPGDIALAAMEWAKQAPEPLPAPP